MDLGGKYNTMEAYIFRHVYYLDLLHQKILATYLQNEWKMCESWNGWILGIHFKLSKKRDCPTAVRLVSVLKSWGVCVKAAAVKEQIELSSSVCMGDI